MSVSVPHRNTTINYLVDTFECRLRGIYARLSSSDFKIIFGLILFLIISFFVSIMIHASIIVIYVVSMVIVFVEYIRFRRKNIESSVKNELEVERFDIHDMKDVITFVGRWPGKRSYMEDEYVICPKNKIFAVFDGHGSNKAVTHIKHNFKQRFRDLFDRVDDNIEAGGRDVSVKSMTIKAMEDAFITLDKDIHDKDIEGGAVGVAVKIDSDKIYCTSIGDSEAYVVTKSNNIKTISKIHTIKNFSEYCRYVEHAHPLRPRVGTVLRTHSGLIPTRSIGDTNHKKRDAGILNIPESVVLDNMMTVDIKTDNNKNNSDVWKLIFIGSDGLWDCIDASKLFKLIGFNISTSDILQNDTELLQNKIIKIMLELHNLTTKNSDIIDKLTSTYQGDNCTFMLIINKNAYM